MMRMTWIGLFDGARGREGETFSTERGDGSFFSSSYFTSFPPVNLRVRVVCVCQGAFLLIVEGGWYCI